jgi:hypothetical protein
VPSYFRGIADRLKDLRTYARDLVTTYIATISLKVSGFQMFHSEDEYDAMRGFPSMGDAPELVIEVEREFTGDAPPLNDDERAVFRKSLVNMGHADRKAALILQHYGIPTGMLDITRGPEVALHFAQFDGNGVRPAKVAPVVYFFFLDRIRDPYLNGEQLYDRLGALRPARQQCGAMLGATMVTSNTYARYISAQVHLDGTLVPEGVDQDFLFPSEDDDKALHLVRRAMGQTNEPVVADLKTPSPAYEGVTLKFRFRGSE